MASKFYFIGMCHFYLTRSQMAREKTNTMGNRISSDHVNDECIAYTDLLLLTRVSKSIVDLLTQLQTSTLCTPK